MSRQWSKNSWDHRNPGPKNDHWQRDSSPSGSSRSNPWEEDGSWDQEWRADDDWNYDQHQEWQRQTWEEDSKDDWAKEPRWPEEAWEKTYGKPLTEGAQLRPRNQHGQAQGSAGSVASDEGAVAEKAPKSKKKKKKAYVATEAERRAYVANTRPVAE